MLNLTISTEAREVHVDIGTFDAWFLRRYDALVDESRSPVSTAFMRAELDALDEDRFIARLGAGLTTVNFPGIFGLTLRQFISYPDIALNPGARERAREAVHAWSEWWRALADRWFELTCLLQIAYAPGDPDWEPVRVRAYSSLAARIPFAAHSRAVRHAIARKAREQQCSRAVIQHAALESGLALAWGIASADSRPRTMRFGKDWVKDATTGRALAVQPGVLRWQYLWKWLCQESARLATADLLGEPLRPVRPSLNGGDMSGLLAAVRRSPSPQPAEAATGGQQPKEEEQQAHALMRAKVASLFAGSGMTPRELDVAAAFGLHPTASSAEIGALLGISPSTVRGLRRRLTARRTPPPS
jgi:DNA-binding CsgD family transcriptional regulator